MRCPVCRAADNQGLQCRRCKADLGLLVRLEASRRRLLRAATAALARGDGDACGRNAEQAHRLRRGDDSSRLLAVAALLRRDFGQAWACYIGRLQNSGLARS
jgi:hypothetical protein